MSKLYQTFKSPSQVSIDHLFHTIFLSVSVSEFVVKNIQKNLPFSGTSCRETLFWQKQIIPAPLTLKSISLLLISPTFYFISQFNHSFMSAVGEETSEPEIEAIRWKLCCHSSPNHLTLENFVSPSAFCLSFIYFVFVSFAYWDHHRKFAGFDSLKPNQKILTKSP